MEKKSHDGRTQKGTQQRVPEDGTGGGFSKGTIGKSAFHAEIACIRSMLFLSRAMIAPALYQGAGFRFLWFDLPPQAGETEEP